MILDHLREILSEGVVEGKEEREGSILVDGEPSGSIWLRRGGALELGRLNDPLGPYLKFEEDSISRSNQEPPTDQWEPVAEVEINWGLHLFLLIDPRTYDKIYEMADNERIEIVPHRDGVSVRVRYPLEEIFREFKIPDIELNCIVDMLGQWWQTSFFFGPDRLEIFVRDPLFEDGVVVQF